MKFSKWVVSYTKVFHNGPLVGMEVECYVSYTTEDGAKGFCDWVTASPNGSDAQTRHNFTVIKSSYEEVVIHEG